MFEDEASSSAHLSDHSVNQPSTETEKLLSASIWNSGEKNLELEPDYMFFLQSVDHMYLKTVIEFKLTKYSKAPEDFTAPASPVHLQDVRLCHDGFVFPCSAPPPLHWLSNSDICTYCASLLQCLHRAHGVCASQSSC